MEVKRIKKTDTPGRIKKTTKSGAVADEQSRNLLLGKDKIRPRPYVIVDCRIPRPSKI